MNKSFITIFLIVFIDLLGFGIIIPILPYISERFGANAFQIGLLTATYSAFQLVATPILGRLSDRYGRKKLLIISQLGSVLGYLLMAFGTSLPLLFLARAIDGATGGNISIAQAYIADISTKKNRARSMGIIGGAFGLGFIFGPLLGGLLSNFSYSAPAFAAAAVGLISTITSVLFLQETVEVKKAEHSQKTQLSVQNIFKVLTKHPIGTLILAFLTMNIAFSVLQVNFVLWTQKTFHYSATQNGLMLTYIGVLSVIAQLVILPQVLKRLKERQILFIGTLSTMLGFLFIPIFAHPYLLFVSLIFTNFGFAIANPVYQSLTSENVNPEEYGEVLGLLQSAGSLGRIVGPIIAGGVFNLLGKDIPFYVSAAMAFGIFVFLKVSLQANEKN